MSHCSASVFASFEFLCKVYSVTNDFSNGTGPLIVQKVHRWSRANPRGAYLETFFMNGDPHLSSGAAQRSVSCHWGSHTSRSIVSRGSVYGVKSWRQDSALGNNSIRKFCAFRSQSFGNQHWDFSLPQKDKCPRKHQAKLQGMFIFTKVWDHQVLYWYPARAALFLGDELRGDSLGWERVRGRGNPQRVLHFTVWHLHNVRFTCRTSHLLLLTVSVIKWILFTGIKEKPPSELLDNRMK